MGVLRDLKKANEAYWAGKISQEDLLAEGKRLRLAHWKIQKDAGVDIIPSNDFAHYDHVLDHIQFFNVRYILIEGLNVSIDQLLCC
jgi:5-methyltetrahydropteroyltriglutamate--homocysteine methyltransferase